jgi:hypothetical protein
MLNKLLLTALVLMLNYTTAYAGVDCSNNVDCVPALLVKIDGIDQLKARVIVTLISPEIYWQKECTPIDWVGNCKIDKLPGAGSYSATVSFGVTAPLSRFHCDYFGNTSFDFDGVHQADIVIQLRGNCYRWPWDETAASNATD